MANSPNIAVIGGGTGSFTLLQELKTFTPNISAIVNMSDDGSSTGVLRDEFGVLPPGDIRQCLVALSDAPEVRDIFTYRFDSESDSSLAGHTIGNLILSGLELKYGDFDKALKVASSILNITGQVIPATLENHVLHMQDGGELVKGEYKIGHRLITNRDAIVSLEPPADLNPEAQEAINKADLVVVAPGNLFGSLLPALAVDGMKQAFDNTSAKKVVVSNLVTKPGQTDGWHVVDYVKTIEQYVGEGQIDVALYNKGELSTELLENYAADGELPVSIEPERFAEVEAVPIGANLVARDIFEQDRNDKALLRTLIRHDARQVGHELMRIFYQ